MTLTVTEKWTTRRDRNGVSRRSVEWTAREGSRIVARARSQECDPARDATGLNGQIDADALKHMIIDALGPDIDVDYVRKASDKDRAVPRLVRVTFHDTGNATERCRCGIGVCFLHSQQGHDW